MRKAQRFKRWVTGFRSTLVHRDGRPRSGQMKVAADFSPRTAAENQSVALATHRRYAT